MSARVDFLKQRRTPLLGWVLLALGVTSALAAWQMAQHWRAEQAAQEAEWQQREAVLQRARERALRPRQPSVDEQRAVRARAILQRPWLPALRAIEGVTQEPVYLLGLSIEPTSGRVRVDAEAPSFDHALAYVQRLGEDGALAPAQLVSHESFTDVSDGRSAVRFSAVTQWRTR